MRDFRGCDDGHSNFQVLSTMLHIVSKLHICGVSLSYNSLPLFNPLNFAQALSSISLWPAVIPSTAEIGNNAYVKLGKKREFQLVPSLGEHLSYFAAFPGLFAVHLSE